MSNNMVGCAYCNSGTVDEDILYYNDAYRDVWVWLEGDEIYVKANQGDMSTPNIHRKIRFCPMCGTDLRWFVE